MHLEHSEALLFRMLVSFFGEDRVIPQMSVMAVCGGELPPKIKFPSLKGEALNLWAKKNKCLFTVVDREDNPKMVVEFFSGFENFVNVTEAEHMQYLKPLLEAREISYITMSPGDFAEICSPDNRLDFFHWLKDKVSVPA